MTSLHRLLAIIAIWFFAAASVAVAAGMVLFMPWAVVLSIDLAAFAAAAVATWAVARAN